MTDITAQLQKLRDDDEDLADFVDDLIDANRSFRATVAAALAELLAEQKIAVLERFGRVLSHALDLEHEIDNSELQHYHLLEFLASPLKTRVLAACAALGISTED